MFGAKDCFVSILDFFKRSYLAYFSKPAGRRPLYRQFGKRPAQTIVQLGISDIQMTANLIWLAQASLKTRVRYVGVDLFEMRPESLESLGLKDAHRHLAATGAKVKLIPGDPYSALARSANSLTGTDWILISSNIDAESLERAWFYVPRMLHSGSSVYRQLDHGEQERFVLVPRAEIDRRSVAGYDAKRRAA